jgi:CRP-like cAMP-binding protein
MKEVETLSVIEKALLLSEWSLFRELATDEVALIAARTGEVEYEAGEIVDPEGPTGSSVHLVVSGAIEVSMEEKPIRTAGAGEAIGSLAILGAETTDEKLRVVEPTHALVLSAGDFESAVADHPEFTLALLRSLMAFMRGIEAAPGKTAKEE